MKLWFLVLVFQGISYVSGECPNGCSGNGDCAARDQCSCYPGYMGNDCSEYICPFGSAHVDTPKGDLNFDRTITTSAKVAISTPIYPNGAYEGFPDAIGNQAHFSMECSNNGICDRSKGVCECFPGYEGNACQRQGCPNHCSERGTCETISSLASKASGTLYQNIAKNGDTTYALWDADLIQGCRCDPWYSGADCSHRSCKVGIDPLYSDRNTPIYEKFLLVIGTTSAATFSTSLSTFRLRLFDYYGESYLTKPIVVTTLPVSSTDCPLCTLVQNAVLAIPNKPFPSFTCSAIAAQYTTRSTGGNTVHTLTCSFSYTTGVPGAPGVLRLPEMEEVVMINSTSPPDIIPSADIITAITGTTLRGEDYDWASLYLGLTVSITNGATNIDGAFASTLTVGQLAQIGTDAHYLIRIANQYLVYSSSTHALIWPWTLPTLANARIYNAPTGSLAQADQVNAFAFGGTVMTTVAAPSVVRGDWIIFQNQIFHVLLVDTTNKHVTVDRPFYGTAAAGASVTAAAATTYTYKITDAATNKYQYVGECSFKGLCDYTTGLCTCFKGYTGDNCQSQNAIAH